MQLQPTYPFYLANRPHQPNLDLAVTDKFSGSVATQVARADARVLDLAIECAEHAAGAMRSMAAHEREDVLRRLADQCVDRADELAAVICTEAGKPIAQARCEVARLVSTIHIAAHEALRLGGEVMTLDIAPSAEGYRGMWKRVPIGPCGFITPWSFPVNLVAHKIAPALACGCPFVLKPASMTPVGALILGELLSGLDLPEGAFSILPMKAEDAGALVEDDRIRKLSFTGSAKVGWELRRRAGKKRVTLELSGNAAVLVEPDANLQDAVDRLVAGAFVQAGQSCISVQRIYVHEDVYDEVRDGLVAATRALKAGDPSQEDVVVGPLITEEAARRVERWVAAAVASGATLLCGGGREGTILEPVLLESPPYDTAANDEEVFGPVAVVHRYRDFDDAIRLANDTRYGLQAGIFTRDIEKVERAWDELVVGGVMVNETPSWRVDHMPYGGVKDSGLGREGLRWAVEGMTEMRLLVIRSVGAA